MSGVPDTYRIQINLTGNSHLFEKLCKLLSEADIVTYYDENLDEYDNPYHPHLSHKHSQGVL